MAYFPTIAIGVPFFRAFGGSGLDPDAQAFITAAGITDATQINAINRLVKNYKGVGDLNNSVDLWTGAKAIYPFVGGTASTNKFNLKDPRDLDVAFRLSFFGGWTHSVNGAKPNGTNAYADTFLNLSTELTQNNLHISTYLRDNIITGDGVDLGNSSALPNFYFSAYYFSNLSLISNINNIGIKSVAQTDTRGFYLSERVSSSARLVYKNGSLIDTFSVASIAPINAKIRIAANNLTNEYSSRQTAFISVGEGLTSGQVTTLNTIIQQYQTDLSRQV
jgi:hypothetical protein